MRIVRHNWPCKYILYTSLLLGCSCFSQYQNNDDELRDYFSSILFLSESGLQTVQMDGQQFEVLYRKPWTETIVEKKTIQTGTGFLIYRGIDVYLITAEHVARVLKSTSQVKYRGIDGQKKEITIKELTLDKDDLKDLVWIRHPAADVAVLHLGIIDNIVKDIVPINYEYLINTLKAPNRFNDLTIIGFPLGLGVNPNDISPITRNTRSGSDIVYFPRFDNGIINPFIIMDDPSVGGFSGGPVMEIRKASNKPLMIEGEKAGIAPTLVGLVHGTLAPNHGGFAAIVPAFQIIEALRMAPKFNGEYTFYYPNGRIWSKRVYKDGLPWTVLSNYGPDGEPQEKGTLKEGEGTLYAWNEKGTLAEVIHCSNGDCNGGVYMVKDKTILKH